MLGFDRDDVVVALNDTAELTAAIFNVRGEPIEADDLSEVVWEIEKPDKTRDANLLGDIDDQGIGTLKYDDTDQAGWHIAVASFTLADGTRRSVTTSFEVYDPFNPPEPTNEEIIANLVWDKVEDCFDSEEEGPWLRDMTMNIFNKGKMADFIAEGVFDINQQNPPTDITIDGFFASNGVPNSDAPLLVQGTFLSVVRHLMRSYVEQPQPMGSQVVYEDRREYLQRWQTIYQIEMETYSRWIALWKRKYLQLGKAKGLVATKAGRLIPAPLRTRNIGRGYY